jgi:hypothetical protein
LSAGGDGGRKPLGRIANAKASAGRFTLRLCDLAFWLLERRLRPLPRRSLSQLALLMPQKLSHGAELVCKGEQGSSRVEFLNFVSKG